MLRGQEGLGLGDVKLLAMLGGWLGVKGAGICFAIGVAISLVVALILYMVPAARATTTKWSLMKLPFGTFLCAGGIICGLWGNSLLSVYERLFGM
jgi:leader peptidase (prepilin peptidase)/N-methyltransferase